MKAEVEDTAVLGVEVALETGDVLGWHPPDARRGRKRRLRSPLRVASLLLRFCCRVWSRGDRGRSCQLGVEQEQQRFVMRSRAYRHA